MKDFLQLLLSNSPNLIGLVFLYIMIIKLEHKMDMGFKDVISLIKGHDDDIKKIRKSKKSVKKRVTRLEKKVRSHHLMLVRKLDQPH